MSEVPSRSLKRILVVLDDDPTGTQTVHGVPVLTVWSVEILARELATSPVFFVLTNSRALNKKAAIEVANTIGTNLRAAASKAGVEVEVISRGDSTLRGHYPAEVDALADGLGWSDASISIIPYFGPGDRITRNDVHFVGSPDAQDPTRIHYTPVGKTEFARDATFGFTHSNLRQWIEEKTAGRVASDSVVSVSLEDLRDRSIGDLTTRLNRLEKATTLVVNATQDSDLSTFCEALAQSETRHWIHRTAASFVAIRAGIKPSALLRGSDLVRSDEQVGAGGGLVVVGSHVAKTTEQLEQALALPGVVGIELEVERLLEEGQNGHLLEVGSQVSTALSLGSDVVLFTSRKVQMGVTGEDSLDLSIRVSEGLCSVVADLVSVPRFLIAKGGITSSDLATKALGVRRAMVLGQLQPGVAVWELGEESRFPGMSYVVYPGNVGSRDGLADAILRCRPTRA